MASSGGGGGAGGSMSNLISSLKAKAEQSSSFLRSATSSISTSNHISETTFEEEEEEERQENCDAPSLPLPDITHPFPVVEQPPRCILTSLLDLPLPKSERRRLTSTRKGAVEMTTKRGDREQFLLMPVAAADDGAKRQDMFYLRSYKFNRYLTSDSTTGEVSTIDLCKKNGSNGNDQRVATNAKPGESEKWGLMRSPHGGHFIVSAENEMNIACCRDGESSIKVSLKGDNDLSETWEIEFVSGELCFMSSSDEKHIRCDLMGKLSLTEDKRGWEVWRFIEMGGGRVRIVSWMHSQFCIACNHEGTVSTVGIGKAEEGCDIWTVEKTPEGYNGVVIKSVACARRILCRGEEGLSTTQELEGESGIWQLDAAHSQNYNLTSFYCKRSVGPFPYVTENVKQSDQIILQQIDEDDTVRIFHKSHGYLQSCVEGEVGCNLNLPNEESAETSDLWAMEQRNEGGYIFASKMSHGGMLAFNTDEPNPRLCTVSATTDDKREVWNVNPILPRAISSDKIKTFALGTSIAVGTTVAMPFLMAGMLAVVPAEATLAASVLSVGLTSAEAIASVGAIGATAAIVFRESSDTLGIESEHDDGEDGKDFTKRPLCAWRSW